MNDKYYPRVLLISSTGVLALKVLGFLSTIEEKNQLIYTDTYCGISIGAMISLLLVSGLKVGEIVNGIVFLDFPSDVSIVSDMSKLSDIYTKIRARLTYLVIHKFGSIPTLRKLYLMTGKSLITASYNITDNIYEMMNPNTFPDMSCIDAVMHSMNMNFEDTNTLNSFKLYIDGTLSNPYPIDYFDDGNTKILGLYTVIMRDENENSTPYPIVRPSKNNCGIPFGLITDNFAKMVINNASDSCVHVRLECSKMDNMGSLDNKSRMIAEGYNKGKYFPDNMLSLSLKDTKFCDFKGKYSYPEHHV